MKKRILSILLMVCMVFTLLPGFTQPAMAAFSATIYMTLDGNAISPSTFEANLIRLTAYSDSSGKDFIEDPKGTFNASNFKDEIYTLAFLNSSNGEGGIHLFGGNQLWADQSPFTISNTTIYPLTLAFYSVSYKAGLYGKEKEYKLNYIVAEGRGQKPKYLFTRDGYKQIGWSTDEGGATKTYDLDDVIYPTSAMILYPAWGELRAVTIADGAGVGSTKTSATGSVTGSISSGNSAVVGETVTIIPGTPAAGYKLSAVKYNDGADHLLTKSDGKYFFTMPAAAVSISAEFVPNNFAVTYNPGTNGTGSQQIDTKTGGTALTLKSAIYTREGYDQTGWAITNGGVKMYELGGSYTTDAAKDFYPVWTAKSYSIMYTLNGGTVDTANPANYTIESTAINLNNPIRAGFTFLGWTGSNGATAQTNVSIPTSSTGDKTYTANWMADTYSISYALNGGTVSPSNPANYTVESTAINLNNPIRAGFTFLGWTGSNSTTAQTNVSISTGSTGDKTYTANWMADTYSISYALNGGTVDTANPANYTVESPVINLNPPTRFGYSFLGWTGSNSTTAQTNVSILTGSTGDKTYTANWKANKPDKAPATSIVTAKTDTSLTITTQDGYEYSLNGTDWYSGVGSYSFTDLDAETTYNLVYRKAAVDTLGSAYAASEASDALSVITKIASASAPAAPTISTGADKPTSDSITINTVKDNEYYISTNSVPLATWPTGGDSYFKVSGTDVHTFTGLTEGTQYYIHVRVAETAASMPSASTYTAQYTLPVTPETSVITVDYAAETISFDNICYQVSTSADFTTTITSGSTLQPETTYYVRMKAASGAPASEAVSIITTARPATPDAITSTNITRTDVSITILNTVSTQEYSVDGGMTWQTGNNSSLTFNGLIENHAYSVVTRIPAISTAFASSSASALSVTTKTTSVALSDSDVTYSVKDGTVNGLGDTYEYSLNGGSTWQTAPVTGVSFAVGNVIQVRKKETDDAMPSLPQTLGTIGALAAAPAYGIDFTTEKTTAFVPATVEYNTSSATATTWTVGEDTALPLTPGNTYYFRVAATDAALAGNVQTLENPARPFTPDVSVISIAAGEDASHTLINLADTYEYILADIIPDVSALGTTGPNSASEIAAVVGQHVYIRVKATVSAFASDWMYCGEVQLGVDDIILAGVGYNVAAGTLTGTTTNMQYSMDDGIIWQDCAAGNTTDLTFVAGTIMVRQKDKPKNEHTVGIIAPVESSADPMLHSKSYDRVTLTSMTGYEYSIDGGTTWQDSNIFSRLRSGTKYSFVARIKATAATLPGTVSASMTVTTNIILFVDTDTGDSSASTPTGAPVIVDGKTVNIGAENKTGDATTVTVDQSKLGENIDGAAAGSSVVVPVSENSAATASLVVKNIEDMAQKGMTLTVQTGSVAYNLNTSAIDTAALATAFPGADMSEVPFDVTIQNSSVSVEGETLVLSPVVFTVTATFNGKTVSVDTFSAYINRMIEVTEKQAAEITTAVVVNADGSTRHVPTNVIEKDGKYYAIINSRTNSTYALIQNEVTFADASGEWYEAAVNEMGSRKIIDGRSASVFDGGASITRAEFAAILVRALGLPADGTSSFSDVPTTAWYTGAVATAAQYGLVAGKGNNRFDPNANITRQEAMLMLHRASALTELDGTSGALDSFTDADSIDSGAEDAAKWSVGSGIIQGSDGKLNPTANITRAESAVIILRLLQKAGLVDIRS